MVIKKKIIGYPFLEGMGKKNTKSFKSFEDLECWKSCMDMRAKLFVMVIWLKAELKNVNS